MPKPVPKAGELLIRIRATAVAAGDCELRALRFGIGLRVLVRLLMGLTRPRRKILGQEFAGDVEAVGRGCARFRVGDPIYGTTGFGFGAYAEYLCVREESGDGAVAIKPSGITYEEAATIPTGGMEALHFLRKAGTLRGRRVLIIGAGGGIGTLALQIAKHFGAEVTGVDTRRKLDLVRGLGADRVVDFNEEDYTKTSDEYDVILDVVGRSRLQSSMAALRRGGCYLLANPRLSAVIRSLWTSARSGKKLIVRGSAPRTGDLDFLRGLIESGRMRAVIDRRYRLEELPDAHRYVDSGLAIGRVVITL